MNFMRRLLQESKLCTIRNSGVGARHVMSKLCFTTHQVTEKELPQYVENVTSSFDLQSFTYSNIALLKMNHKVNADIFTDSWPNFNCTVIKLSMSQTQTIIVIHSKSQESLEKVLYKTQISEPTVYLRIDQQTYDHSKALITSWPPGYTQTNDIPGRLIYFPGEIPKWSCPEGTYTAELSVDHAYLVSKFWKYFEPEDCLEYVKHVLENAISVGVFLESDPSQPVSWAFLSNYGYISGSHTLEGYRRKGYNRMAILSLMEKMVEANMMPLGSMDVYNTAMVNLVRGIHGFVKTSSTLHHIHKIFK